MVTEPAIGAVVALGPEVWDVAVLGPWVGLVTEPWFELVIELQMVVPFGPWVVVVTEPEVGTVAAIVPEVWVGLVTEPWVELVIELQVVVQFGPAILVEMVVRP